MHILLTGATGLVGQYLWRDLLLEGQDVAVVIRSQGRKTAQERLASVLTEQAAAKLRKKTQQLSL